LSREENTIYICDSCNRPFYYWKMGLVFKSVSTGTYIKNETYKLCLETCYKKEYPKYER
jgi:hypothetical protein